ncbi:MAG: hypothetical protein V1652_01305 [bacterium]
MHIFLDFDDVVFNTKEFIADLQEKLYQSNGIKQSLFKRCYYDDKRDTQVPRVYSLEEHLSRIAEHTNIPCIELQKIGLQHLQTAHTYVFIDMLHFLAKHGKYTTLLSHGDTTFQSQKIAYSKITESVQSILITTALKAEFLKNDAGTKKHFYFIDDRIHQIEAIKKAFPHATTIFVQRKEGRYTNRKTDFADYMVENGNDIISLL